MGGGGRLHPRARPQGTSLQSVRCGWCGTELSDIGRRGRPGRPSGVDVGAVVGQTDATGRVVAGVWAGAPGNVRRGEMESAAGFRGVQFGAC